MTHNTLTKSPRGIKRRKINSEFSGFSPSSSTIDVCSIQPNLLSFADRLTQHFLFKTDNVDGSCQPGFTKLSNEEALLRIMELLGSTLDEETSKIMQNIIRHSLYKTQVPYKVVVHLQAQNTRIMQIIMATDKAIAARLEALNSLSSTYDRKFHTPAIEQAQGSPPGTPPNVLKPFKAPQTLMRVLGRPPQPAMGTFGQITMMPRPPTPRPPLHTVVASHNNSIDINIKTDDGQDEQSMII